MKMDVVLPWEHTVCEECLRRNSHAIWLVKYGCFGGHSFRKKVRVVIDCEGVELVRVRAPPRTISTFRGQFEMCRYVGNCWMGNECKFAHTSLELDTWNAVKSIQEFALELSPYKFPAQSPSKVCSVCFASDPQAVWLSWLPCNKHHNTDKVRVVISSDGKHLEKVREPSAFALQQNPTQLTFHPDCQRDTCHYPHSQEELAYWRWRVVKQKMATILGQRMYGDVGFELMCDKYSYPDGQLVNTCDHRELSCDNYKRTFHKLIYLDSLEHTQKMVDCDGDHILTLDHEYGRLGDCQVHIIGLSSSAMDYVLQNTPPCSVQIRVDKQLLSGTVERRNNISLVVQLDRPHSIQGTSKAFVHFEYNHWYFWRLHRAVDYADSELIDRLVNAKVSNYYPPQWRAVDIRIASIKIDNEYQENALRKMLLCRPSSPFLLMGPFGTGKTHLLVTAITKLVLAGGNRILVCTHQNKGADHICNLLCSEGIISRSLIVRLYPDEKRGYLPGEVCRSIRNISISTLQPKAVIITTFMTALRLKENDRYRQLQLTHIVIDEGAQSREPEALGALLMADSSTHIIVAGDNKQVGPAVSVYSNEAREGGLGVSLLERLLDLYKKKYDNKQLNYHRRSLLTNYRCHPSILMLASSLFYDCTLLSRSKSQPHPCAPYPIVFQCSSFQQDQLRVSDAYNEHEAKLLMSKLVEFIDSWPQIASRDKKPVRGSKVHIAVLAGTAQQVDTLRRSKPKNLPNNFEVDITYTYTIQGSEFDAVFLSTHEPTNKKGKPLNTVRSICNEYVFNTVITRSRSLIFAVGNPFLLVKMGSHFTINCWSELIQRCITCQSFHLPQNSIDPNLPLMVNSLIENVLPRELLEDLPEQRNGEQQDGIIANYIKLLNRREEFARGLKLVQDPRKGGTVWQEGEESGNIVLAELTLNTHCKGVVRPHNAPEIPVTSSPERRCLFPGDLVPVDKATNEIIINEEYEQKFNEDHFGRAIACRVSPTSMIEFIPLDKRYPLLINLPPVTKFEKEGVFCFEPSSLDNRLKVSNFIPKEQALRMVFVVKVLLWRKKFRHPLGITVGALPCGSSIYSGDLLLRVSHHILTTQRQTDEHIPQLDSGEHSTANQHFNDVLTIDPSSSSDHDDALSCKLLSSRGGTQAYEFGVHITDVQKFVPIDSDYDLTARERGSSVYASTNNCVCHMLPEQIVKAASITPKQERDSFSVIASVSIKEKKVIRNIHSVRIIRSTILSSKALTYEQAQGEIFAKKGSRPIKVLYTVACHLRQRRLGQRAAAHISARREDEIASPEAHMLVEEFMIWANQTIAAKLSQTTPMIFRCQSPPDEQELAELVAAHNQEMAVSLDLQQYLPSGQTCPTVQLLDSTIKEIKVALREGSLMKALHLVQFEHLQPQVAVAHALYRQICKSSFYHVSSEDDKDTEYTHSGLHCDEYTRFTSPMRRYVDLMVQRILVAHLEGKANPYAMSTEGDIREICRKLREREREIDKYENGRRDLVLACELQQSSREYVCFVKKIEDGKLFVVYCNPSLKVNRDIFLKHLNAKTMPQKEKSPEPDSNEPTSSQLCTWQVKMASATGNPISFLESAQMEHSSSDKINIDLVFFVPEDSQTEPSKYSDLEEKGFRASIIPPTQSVSGDSWRSLQGFALSPPSHPAAIERLLPSPQSPKGCEFPTIPQSPLWIYTLHRPLTSCEVLNVQLTGCFNTTAQMVCPTVQLLEVGPGLRVCIQHNSSPSECFTDTSLTKLPLQGHSSMEQYFHFWERALLAEAATASMLDTELLIITDVQIVWPQLKKVVDSQGDVFYQLPECDHDDKPEDCCVCMKLSESFSKSSYDFFRISVGDLMCVRTERSSDVSGVFHMVVHSIYCEDEGGPPSAVYLKFVGERPNYISKTMESALKMITFEVQLIPLTVPFKRIYQSVRNLRYTPKDSLSHIVALGKVDYRNCQVKELSAVLPRDQAKVATSLWTTDESKENPQLLNKYQCQAVELACSQAFVMIQGPPGTGKSVTGAHIAYALAMKLRKEVENAQRKTEDLNPCVMYCGPSQQSVNVVLDILISSQEVQASGLKIIRVYSSGIESKDFQGPKYNHLVFNPVKADAKCDDKCQPYALHHLIRDEDPSIRDYDEEFERLKQAQKIPSSHKRGEYQRLVTNTSIAVLKDNVDIVLCTCNEAGSRRIKESVLPEYCVIDECAMATEPESMVAIRRANKVILIGDDKQLQPVLMSRDAKKMGMGTSLFERYCRAGFEPHVLQTQYRMHKALCEFPSNEFYGGQLKTDPSVAVKHSAALDSLAEFWPQGRDCPMMLVDVVGEEEENHTGHRGSARVGLESKRNTDEARIIADLAKELIIEYNIEAKEIAALTPYSAQKEEIKKYLERDGTEGVTVKTITDSQGSEYGIVLLSTVRSQELSNLLTSNGERRKTDFGWRKENLGFITDRHQICVGITRCKYGLIIVGNCKLLCHDQTWEKLVEHYHTLGCIVQKDGCESEE